MGGGIKTVTKAVSNPVKTVTKAVSNPINAAIDTAKNIGNLTGSVLTLGTNNNILGGGAKGESQPSASDIAAKKLAQDQKIKAEEMRVQGINDSNNMLIKNTALARASELNGLSSQVNELRGRNQATNRELNNSDIAIQKILDQSSGTVKNNYTGRVGEYRNFDATDGFTTRQGWDNSPTIEGAKEFVSSVANPTYQSSSPTSTAKGASSGGNAPSDVSAKAAHNAAGSEAYRNLQGLSRQNEYLNNDLGMMNGRVNRMTSQADQYSKVFSPTQSQKGGSTPSAKGAA